MIQREQFEKELKSLKETRSMKGKSASIFELKNRIVGKKKVEQEATVVKDPETEVEITDPAEIRKFLLHTA